MGKQTKVRLDVYITPAQKAALETISQKTDVPVAALVRRAIDALLKGGKR